MYFSAKVYQLKITSLSKEDHQKNPHLQQSGYDLSPKRRSN